MTRSMSGAMRRMRAFRRRMGLCGLLQIHHVIPLQHAQHAAVVGFGYDMQAKRNLLFMPTAFGATHLTVPHRLIHDGGHPKYNAYVLTRLDAVDDSDDMDRLVEELNGRLRTKHSDLPWR